MQGETQATKPKPKPQSVAVVSDAFCSMSVDVAGVPLWVEVDSRDRRGFPKAPFGWVVRRERGQPHIAAGASASMHDALSAALAAAAKVAIDAASR